ncbi:MAG: hypothetical protein NTW13_06635 [Candidatus Omnitrophica bacterium]|nr:hypothetical protein [Candidatus Omnitrophota bacterium]
MKFDRGQKFTLLIIAVVIILNLFANGYLRLRIRAYEAMRLCYEKLAVAYEIGGRVGLEKEYALISSNSKGKLALQFLTKVRDKIDNASDPGDFFRSVIAHEKKDIDNSRILINLAFILMLVILGIRFFINKKHRKGKE